RERFNGHLSKKELIIEIGTTGNTLDEALVSARALAFAINEFYTG
ncbi:MAG: stage II sporulation protein P, partial [Clostridia bacterium]|nr:stage II sporulation protein P [Clostridia bacterium]